MKATRKLANQLSRTSFHRSMPPLHRRATSTERGDRRTNTGESPPAHHVESLSQTGPPRGDREISEELGETVEK